MSPRHCGKYELKLISLWAVDIHDLIGFFLFILHHRHMDLIL